MDIVDLHVHLGDIFCGHDTKVHIRTQSKLAHFLPRLNEYLGFNLLHNSLIRKLQKPESSWKFTQDCIGLSDINNLSQSLDQTGINYACVLAVEPNVSTPWVVEQSKKEPRIVPFLSVHPKDPFKREKVSDYIKMGCKAMKLHPVIQNFLPNSKSVFDLIEEVKIYQLPILCHTGCFSIPHLHEQREYGNINNFIPLIEQFREVPFIIAHMNLLQSEEAIAIAKRFENVYLETSWQTVKNVQKAISALGSERILFGSDWPYAFQNTSLAVVKRACKSDQSFENVAGRNAKRLLRIS